MGGSEENGFFSTIWERVKGQTWQRQPQHLRLANKIKANFVEPN